MQLVNLSEPERSSEAFSHLQYAAMDGLATVVSEMQMLVVEQWLRLKELAQRQMVWLVKQMVGLGAGVSICSENLIFSCPTFWPD